ncbi:MAG: class I SAM-dependent methyltransferase [Chloroflexales bacterium]|nr:class I SAM-dependent methyltransferase [Chloroflexales bacterium]
MTRWPFRFRRRKQAPPPAPVAVNPLQNPQLYANLLQRFERQGYTHEQAVQLTVGGHFQAFGTLERDLLIQYGLAPHHYLIDVGCGSGRLTRALAPYLTGRYLGLDVLPDLLAYARAQAPNPAWRFEAVTGFAIPERDAQADMICFFSVFTHLLHEQSYVYLRDAQRALKPGGHIVFSFMEYGFPSHWRAFEEAITHINDALPLNVFISRDAIAAWAQHLGLDVIDVQDGEKPFIRLREPAVFDHGGAFTELGTIGQSVCVLQKRAS